MSNHKKQPADADMKSGEERIRTRRGSSERDERMYQIARLYYEERKFAGEVCPNPDCLRSLTLHDRVKPACPFCRKAWAPDRLERLNQDDVSNLLSTPIFRLSRSEVQRLLSEAQDSGVVQVLVTRAPRDTILRNLERELELTLGLEYAGVVRGKQDLFDADFLQSNSQDNQRKWRDPILLSAAKLAARVIPNLLDKTARLIPNPLDETASPKKRETLCLAFGYMTHLVVDQLNPTTPRPDLKVVPFVGMLSGSPFYLYDANLLVQEASSKFLCEDTNVYWLPAPGLVNTNAQKDEIMEHSVVKAVLEEMKKATLVVSSVGPLDLNDATLVTRTLYTPKIIEEFKQRYGGIGDMAGNIFDAEGKSCTSKQEALNKDEDGIVPIGLNLEDLADMVKEGTISLAVVAGHPHRVKPLLAAIKGGIVNAIVTDHITAQELLRQHKA